MEVVVALPGGAGYAMPVRSAPALPVRRLTFAVADRRADEPGLLDEIIPLPRFPVLLFVVPFFAFPLLALVPPTVDRPPPPDLPRPAA